jgi:mRNA interferase MazF
MTSPQRGEVWWMQLEPVRGHEPGGSRPALIVSNNIFNQSAADLVVVVPITTKGRSIRSFLPISASQGGLSQPSFIICDQVRTISKSRLGKRSGVVPPNVLAEVERRLKFLLDLH